METIFFLVVAALMLAFSLALFFATGWIHILTCYAFDITYYTIGGDDNCVMANWALLMYGVVFGLPFIALFVLPGLLMGAEKTPMILDRLFGWFYSGTHPASGIVRRSSRQAAEEFARVMQAQHYDDLRARELFGQMGNVCGARGRTNAGKKLSGCAGWSRRKRKP